MGANSNVTREMTEREKLELDVKLARTWRDEGAVKFHKAVAALDAFGPEPDVKNEADDLARKV